MKRTFPLLFILFFIIIKLSAQEKTLNDTIEVHNDNGLTSLIVENDTLMLDVKEIPTISLFSNLDGDEDMKYSFANYTDTIYFIKPTNKTDPRVQYREKIYNKEIFLGIEFVSRAKVNVNSIEKLNSECNTSKIEKDGYKSIYKKKLDGISFIIYKKNTENKYMNDLLIYSFLDLTNDIIQITRALSNISEEKIIEYIENSI